MSPEQEETNNTGVNQSEETSQISSLASGSSHVIDASAVERQSGADNNNASNGDQELPQTFPHRLFDILSNDNYKDIVGWLEHGKGFVIRDKRAFGERVLPKYFKKSKFTSFTRKLNRWNFTRVTRGPETGAYYHPLFTKGAPKLILQMSCINAKHTQQIHPMDPVALGIMNQAGNALAQQQYNFAAAMMQQQVLFQQQQACLQQMAIAQQAAQQAAQQSNTGVATTSTASLGNNQLGPNANPGTTQQQEMANQQQLAFNLYQQQQYFTMMMAQQAQQQQFQMQTMGAAMAQQAQQAQQFQQRQRQQQVQAQRLEQDQHNLQWQPQQFQQTEQSQPQLLRGQGIPAADITLQVSQQNASNIPGSNDFDISANNETIEPGVDEIISDNAALADDASYL